LAKSEESKRMNERVLLVTEPDDTLEFGSRILLIDLDPAQNEIVSKSLGTIENFQTLIVYSWKLGDSVDWLIDKSLKSQITFFNANSQNQTLVGYFSGRPNSYYFGNLLSLSSVNKFSISSSDQISNILNNLIEKHGQ
jgi:hypothetical protein